MRDKTIHTNTKSRLMNKRNLMQAKRNKNNYYVRFNYIH